jgi:membrane glycosyltransferase
LTRANELAAASHRTIRCPLHELRNDQGLLDAHLHSLADRQPRKRGEIDPHLAVARARIEDAETFDEATGFLRPREKFAVLNSAVVLGVLMKLPNRM